MRAESSGRKTKGVERQGVCGPIVGYNKTEDHRGREGKNKIREGDKPKEILNHRKQTESC